MSKQNKSLQKAKKIFKNQGWIPISCRIYLNEEGKYTKPPVAQEWSQITKDTWEDKFQKKLPNFGVLTGEKSGIIVVDVDIENDTLKIWENMQKENGEINTIQTISPTKGYHYYFKWFENDDLTTSSNCFKYEGKKLSIDIRTDGGFIVLPPSKNPIGKYKWINKSDNTELAQFPAWLLKYLIPKEKRKENSSYTSKSKIKDKTLSPEFKDAIKYKTSRYLAVLFHKLIKKENNLVCIDPDKKSFYHFEDNTKLWSKVCQGFVSKLVFNTLKDAFQKELTSDDPEMITNIGKLIAKIGEDSCMNQIVKNMGIYFYDERFEGDLDSREYLVSFKNGVYDLKTNNFRERKKEDHVTQTLDYCFKESNEGIVKEIEKTFMNICNDDQVIYKFMMSWLAYCLTGETKEQIFLDIVGHTAKNGKSTLLKIFEKCFSIYYFEIHKSTFDESYHKEHKQFNKCRAPVRLVHGEEIKRKNLDVDRIKVFVDGNKMNNEVMYGTCEELILTCKLVITTNHDIKFDNDEGIKRRGLLVQLTNQFISKEKYDNLQNTRGKYIRNKELLKKFDSDDYKIAVFHIINQFNYYNNPFVIPKLVKDGFEELSQDNDQMEQYLDNFIERTNKIEDRISKQMFWNDYNSRMNTNTEWTTLLSNLKRFGVKYDRAKRVNGIKGCLIGVKFIIIEEENEEFEF